MATLNIYKNNAEKKTGDAKIEHFLEMSFTKNELEEEREIMTSLFRKEIQLHVKLFETNQRILLLSQEIVHNKELLKDSECFRNFEEDNLKRKISIMQKRTRDENLAKPG